MKIFLAIVCAVSSCIQGYHVLYGVIRMAVMGEQLLCEQKPGPRPGLDVVEQYALVVKKDSCVTSLLAIFLRNCGI